ncbi:MAG TPA: hypothetical protein VG225_01070 [Terracidiphilus sp.]|jgi:hypothetical protein|nr:hypothetical protein [Terracidiphilus sp.]
MNYLKMVCLSGSLCATAALVYPAAAQEPATTTTSGPAAYVYVSSTPKNSSVNEIIGYAAAPNGVLTALNGSPYTADVTTMAVNGKYLFGANKNGVYIDSYHIRSNGSLSLWEQTDVAKFNYNDCGSSGPLFLDHTGQTLYDMEFDANGCANNEYESLAVNKADGALSNIGSSTYTSWLYQAASFIGNNVYAYSVACIGNSYWTIFGEQRASNGLLTSIGNFKAPLPTPKSGDFWCPAQAAADPTDHVAMVMQPVNGSTFASDGGAQIASFTAASNGNLSTTNTRSTMPVTSVGTALSISMAPSGKLLAVGGSAGLQIFHFNGASAATKDTGLLTTAEIDQMFWDDQNHLYAISRSAGRLYVFTITPTSVSQAAGSPHAITGPQNIAVQPLP